MNDSINLILILGELLNGNRDLSNYILCLKEKKEKEDKFLESRDFWIENNFYNWLNHDLVIRKSMGLHMLEAYSEDKQSRFSEAYYQEKRCVCIYLPNGNPKGTEKFVYKLEWMDRFSFSCYF